MTRFSISSRRRYFWPALAASLLLLCAGPASAGVVFDNYPPDGSIDGWTINGGWVVSDSFTLSSPVTLDGVNIALWTDPSATATSVDWSIGSTFFGSDIDSGTATLTEDPTVTFSNTQNDFGFGYWNVVSYTFTLPDDPSLSGLAAGTYYLTLQNAAATDVGSVFWDENDDPNGLGITFSQYGSCCGTDTPNGAQSFQILGSSSAPEPAGFVLLGSGLLMAGLLRRKASLR